MMSFRLVENIFMNIIIDRLQQLVFSIVFREHASRPYNRMGIHLQGMPDSRMGMHLVGMPLDHIVG